MQGEESGGAGDDSRFIVGNPADAPRFGDSTTVREVFETNTVGVMAMIEAVLLQLRA